MKFYFRRGKFINSKNKKHIYSKRKGFTLLDTIISFALFTIMLTGVYMMIVTSMKSATKSEEKQSGALYGQQILEQIRDGSVSIDESTGEVSSISYGIKKPDLNSGTTFTADLGQGYTGEVRVSKNTSITLGEKEVTTSAAVTSNANNINSSIYEFDIGVSGDEGTVYISMLNSSIQGQHISFNNAGNCFGLKLKAKKVKQDNKDKIMLEVDDEKNNPIQNSVIDINEDINEIDKKLSNAVLKANMNFGRFKSKETQGDKKGQYKKIKIQVYNDLDIPLNLCLVKPDIDMDIEVETKVGKANLFDNRSENSGKNDDYKELFNVDVKIIKDREVVFESCTNQNLSVQKSA